MVLGNRIGGNTAGLKKTSGPKRLIIGLSSAYHRLIIGLPISTKNLTSQNLPAG